MKKLLFAFSLVALVACGGSKSGDDKAAEAKSKYFKDFSFNDANSLEGGVTMGQTMDEVKKAHAKDSMTDSDVDYVTFDRELGPKDSYNYASWYYSFDSDSKKLDYSTLDIYPGSKQDAKDLYDDIVAAYDGRFGKGKVADDKDWVGFEWHTTINSVKTIVNVDLESSKDSQDGWITITYQEDYE